MAQPAQNPCRCPEIVNDSDTGKLELLENPQRVSDPLRDSRAIPNTAAVITACPHPFGPDVLVERKCGLHDELLGGEVDKKLSLWQYRACRAPGTTAMRLNLFPEKIYLALSEISAL